MANIKLILFISLSLIAISSEALIIDNVDENDMNKCQAPNEKGSITTKTCTSISSSFNVKQSKCCKVTINMDTLERFKATYEKDWRKIGAEQYGFDENLPEEEIRELYIKNEKKNVCSMMTGNIEDYDYFFLYSYSLFSIGRKITYDCGDGKKTYNGKNFNPKNKEVQKLRDTFEPLVQTNKTDCYKAASNFLTNDVLACWNKINKVDEKFGKPERERCQSYEKSYYKSDFTNKFQDYKRSNGNIEETWKCWDKSGKKIKIYMNTFNNTFTMT